MLDKYDGFANAGIEGIGFYQVHEIDGRWWLITPEGNKFYSMGVNHFDLAVLKYPDNVHIFREKYGASDERYIKEGIAKPLREWGFNTIGWTEDQVSGEWMNPERPMTLSPEWHYYHYKWAGMPFVYNFWFSRIEFFNYQPYYPDVFDEDFATWADYLARTVCVDMADEPLLIGYADVPMPDFTRQIPGSWAKNLDLENNADLDKLKGIVRKYFEVQCEAIRRYDPNHLIFGPRFNSNTPEWVVEIAGEYFDVIQCNWFVTAEDAKTVLKDWSEIAGRPTLISDMGFLAPTEILDLKPGWAAYRPDQKTRGEAYVQHCEAILPLPYLVGFHWCGFIENRSRKTGLKNYLDEPYLECVNRMKEFNRGRLYELLSAN